MDDGLAKAIAEGIVRLFIDFPFAILTIRLWVWLKAFEWFELPSPSWMQTWGVAFLLVMLAP